MSTSLTRRTFLKGTGAVLASALTVSNLRLEAQAQGKSDIQWDKDVDILVVGTGAAAFMGALEARDAGNSVHMLEKAATYGGTTAKSGGGYWIPNNTFLQEAGIQDPKDWCLKYMARCSYPDRYAPDAEWLGLSEREYSLLEAHYDNGNKMLESLLSRGYTAMRQPSMGFPDRPAADYYADHSENKAPRGRLVCTRGPNGEVEYGASLAENLKNLVEQRNVSISYRTPADRLIMNERGEVVGLQAKQLKDGKVLNMRARKAVIFGSGGFTHNKKMRNNYLRGPIISGCAVAGSEGDFVRMGMDIGADLGNMNNAFWAQVVLDHGLKFPSPPTDLFMVPGDSMIHVNKYGKRTYDEKQPYHNRTPVQFNWDDGEREYPNQLMFMIWDQRTHEEFDGQFPISFGGGLPPYVKKADSIGELAGALDEHLARYSDKIGNVRLDDDFASNLQQTIMRFNDASRKGVDEDFHRGEPTYDVDWHARPLNNANPYPNITMHPLSLSGPFYAAVIGAGTLDTNGGPLTNAKAQVMDVHGDVIPGLYGAGNCIASPAGRAYWGGGATLGPAMSFGYIAGLTAADEPVKEIV